MALREDVAKLDRYIEQMDFLYQHKIEDKQSLQVKLDSFLTELKSLYTNRRKLCSEKKFAVRHNDRAKIEKTKSEIRDNARKIRELKKQIKLCDAVFVSSDRILGSKDAPAKTPLTEPQIQPVRFGRDIR